MPSLISPSQWIAEHDSLQYLVTDLKSKTTQRNNFPKNSMAYNRIDGQIQKGLLTFREKLSALEASLEASKGSPNISSGEIERRQRLLNELTVKLKQFSGPVDAGRTALLGPGASSQYGTNGWNDDLESNRSPVRDLPPADMRQQQQQLMRDQDQGLDRLADIISRQRTMAGELHREVDLHNEILDDIGDNMDTANQRLLRNTRNIKIVSGKDNTCCLWVVILLLLVAIVVVSVA